jgi:hypothetical protein
VDPKAERKSRKQPGKAPLKAHDHLMLASQTACEGSIAIIRSQQVHAPYTCPRACISWGSRLW